MGWVEHWFKCTFDHKPLKDTVTGQIFCRRCGYDIHLDPDADWMVTAKSKARPLDQREGAREWW